MATTWATVKRYSKRLWHFLWKDNSAASWVVNLILAFLIIRYLVYPGLGLILGTSYPIVAVVSESMEHGLHRDVLCGESFREWKDSFNNYWSACGTWYEERGISKEQFQKFPFRDGFDKGDVIILWRANGQNLKIGDILVFRGTRPQPIIHRVIRSWDEGGQHYYQTKGDHNRQSIEGDFGETSIAEERVLGKGMMRIPYLGWVKILFVEALRPLGINIQR